MMRLYVNQIFGGEKKIKRFGQDWEDIMLDQDTWGKRLITLSLGRKYDSF